ncbi:MAG: hypothetical protein ABJC09_16760 [Terriglobia bacterium]
MASSCWFAVHKQAMNTLDGFVGGDNGLLALTLPDLAAKIK